MSRGKTFREAAPTWAAFSLVVLWMGALAACAYEDGINLVEFMGHFAAVLEHPLVFHWTPYTPRFLAGALAVYACAIGFYYATRQNRRPGEEHGSARWGSVRALDRKYRDKDPANNVILSQHLKMGLDGRKHRRNLLQIVVGGSGSGKTRFLVKPNVYLANTSFIVTDPKGSL